jgi:Protein of unknown function with HXXEE motif
VNDPECTSAIAAEPFRRLAWLAPAALAIHEAEEWNILRWYRTHWGNVGDLSNRVVWTWLIFYSLLGFAVAWIATRFRNVRVTAFIIVFFFAFPFLHGFLHVYWVVYFRAYSPGVVTSVGLLIPACALLAGRAVHERLVPLWFVVLSLLLNLPQFVGAIRLGDRLPDEGLPFYRLAEALARLLPGGT